MSRTPGPPGRNTPGGTPYPTSGSDEALHSAHPYPVSSESDQYTRHDTPYDNYHTPTGASGVGQNYNVDPYAHQTASGLAPPPPMGTPGGHPVPPPRVASPLGYSSPGLEAGLRPSSPHNPYGAQTPGPGHMPYSGDQGAPPGASFYDTGRPEDQDYYESYPPPAGAPFTAGGPYNPNDPGYFEDPRMPINTSYPGPYSANPFDEGMTPGPGVQDEQGAYLLKPYPQPQAHALGFSNDNDSISYVGDDVDDFRPFPVAGDQYALNTYEDEETDYSDESSQGPDYSFDQGEAPPPMPPPPAMAQPMAPPPLEMQPRRAKSMKRVRLYRGNLVLDCPVSMKLLTQFQDHRDEQREFTHMRYSAATCDPNDFRANQFTLRQRCYTSQRETELFIVITLYNENDILLGRTLQGVFRNIKHLVSRSRSKVWGTDAWKKVVVCVVADGRDKIHPRALALMAALGVYQEGFAKNMVNDRPVAAHIYEYTTRVGISSVDKTVKLMTDKTVPVQMIFCLKEKNQKKINSHRWFFNAFGPILNPKVCVLLDAGTQPGHDSIYHLWKTFDLHRNVGGACGEITAQLGAGWTNLLNPLVAAQNFEYKMSNILDKPLESVFGFISVLPGAFSAYRYVALQSDLMGNGPLVQYFKGETLNDTDAGIFTANMFLAEDRILCWELVAKRDSDWLLKYVKSAHAETDVPDKLAELVLQRRRWLNGSFFAAVYAQSHMLGIWRSSHSILRKLMLHLEFFYQALSMLFSWFSIGNFFLVFRILTSSLGDPSLGFAPGKALSVILLWVYCGCIVTIFVLSFGNRPKGTQSFYIVMVGFFAILMAYLMFAAIYISVKSVQFALCTNGGFSASLVIQNQTFRDLVISIASTYALYFLSSFLFFEPWHMFTSFLQYLLLSPSYINVLNVYAFCNIHDISWGTKGDAGQKLDLGVAKTNTAGKLEMNIPTRTEDIDKAYVSQLGVLANVAEKENERPSLEDKNKDYYALFRSSVVLIWVFTNIALIAVVLNTAGLSVFTEQPTTNGVPQSTRALELLQRAAGANCGTIGTGESKQTQIYLSVVLWSVAALAAFRFVGAIWYLILRLFGA